MHKVPNYGSALQAYALQKKVESLGFDAELVDYYYPNQFHCAGQNVAYFPPRKMSRLLTLYLMGKILLLLGLKRQKAKEAIQRYELQKSFRKFYNKCFKLSRYFGDVESLKQDCPSYDIYMTGSDQVWNPRFIVGDDNFLLGFAPEDKPKVSYASSFSSRRIDSNSEDLYRSLLNRYSFISVREKSGVDIVGELTGKNADVVCDPTLLLNKEEWLDLCPLKSLMKDKFLLLYIQSYSYDPYPNIVTFTRKLAEKMGLKVAVLMGLKEGSEIEGATYFETVGPLEFLQLFRDASFVVTTSFHGTAFALNFQKDFYSVVKKIEDNDSRIVDFLRQCGAEHHLIEIEDASSVNSLPDFVTAEKEMEGLSSFRSLSLTSLKSALESSDK